jgi:hypothetical protein
LPKPLARMQNPRSLAPDDGHGRGADPHDQVQPAQRLGTE